MSTLILTLPLGEHTAQTAYPYTLTSDGHSASRHASAPAALLPDPGRGGQVVAVVPLAALSWQQLRLPQGASGQPVARLRAILEGMLEEQLLDEPGALHFALQPGAHEGGPVWVAVCQRAWLHNALQLLEQAGRPVARIVPALAPDALPPPAPALASGAGALPGDAGQGDGAAQTPLASQACTVLGEPDAAWAVWHGNGPQGLLVLPLEGAAALLRSAGSAPHAPDTTLEPPALRAEPAVAAQAERLLGRPAQLLSASELALQAARSDWDLAQLELARNRHQRALRRWRDARTALLHAPQWRAARWALGVALVAQLVGLQAWAWQERQSLAAKQQAIGRTLTHTFPHVSVVVDAPLQMERELVQLRQATGSLSTRDLEPLLAGAAQAWPEAPPPSRVDYRPGELRLHGLGISAQALNQAQAGLAALGLQARQEGDAVLVQAATSAASAMPPARTHFTPQP